MKILIKISFIYTLIFMTILSPNIFSNENKWKVEIELDKQSYVLHEPIWVDITVTNKTLDTIRTHGLDLPNHREFTIELRDHMGKAIEHSGWEFMIGPDPGQLLLEAGEQDYGSFDLQELFGLRDNNSGYEVMWLRFPNLQKGTYTVHVQFEEAISNVLSFAIIEPIGEEKEVIELIEKASNNWVKYDTDSAAQIFQEVVDTFPGSGFEEKCFYLTKVNSQDRKDRVRQGKYDDRILDREMLMNYPNSGNSKSWLLSITRDLYDDKKLEILNKYINDYPNTRCYKFAKQMKERILKYKDK